MINCGSGVQLKRNVCCKMRDGIELTSDHYYPAEPGPHPTLLVRQPYGKDIATTVVYAHPVWFARHGYNVVIQDVRGRGESAGEFYPFRHEAQDGFDTIAWLATLPECDGQVGMYGFSYQGMTQWLAAAEKPPALKVIAPAMTATDLFHGWFYMNGALRQINTIGWGMQMLREDARRSGLRETSVKLERAWTDLRPEIIQAPMLGERLFESDELPTYLGDWMRQNQPGKYWEKLDVSSKIAAIDIPALHVSGWYDSYLNGSVLGFDSLRIHPHQYLLAGPWMHIPWGRKIGEMDCGEAAALDTDTILLQWFNHWLKNSGEFKEASPIRHFVLGKNEWQNASGWASNTEGLTLYLQSNGAANSSTGDGILSTEPPIGEQPYDIFIHDPEVPFSAPNLGDQTVLEQGNNVLIYTTPPLQNDVQILGRPRLRLYAISSAAHTDFVGKLVSVSPTGRATFICIGIARSQFIFGETYSADTIHFWDFELEPTSCFFPAGHSIRLEIASSAFPLFDRNPGQNIHSALADSWNWKRSTQMILHNPAQHSCLILPIVAA